MLGSFTIVILSIIQRYFPCRRDITGQNVLITGAGMGIGREMAFKFADEGCNLILWDINEELILKVSQELMQKYPDIIVFICQCDVSKQIAVHEAAFKTLSKVNHVDILVNNAGIVSGNQFLILQPNQIERTMGVNFFASCWTCKEFLPKMIERQSGHIVTISSLMGLIAGAGLTDYCASKFAVLGFAHALRMELYNYAPNKVFSTIICPYAINTGMFAGIQVNFQWLFPILTPEEVAIRVVNAVIYKEIMVVIPWTVEWIECLTRLLPMQIRDYINIICGGLHGMDHFTGRGNGNSTFPIPVESCNNVTITSSNNTSHINPDHSNTKLSSSRPKSPQRTSSRIRKTK